MSDYWFSNENKGDTLAQAVFGTAEALIGEQSGLRERWRQCAQFYLDREVGYLAGGAFRLLNLQHGDLDTLDAKAPAWSLCRSLTNALVSHVSLQQPAPKVQTTAAREVTQSRAKKTGRFLVGSLRGVDAYPKARHGLRYDCVLGTHFRKVWPDAENGKVRTKVYSPDRILVDNGCGADIPPSLFHVDLVDKGELLAMFPGRTVAAVAARRMIDDASVVSYVSGIRQLVEVVEGWRLPTGDGPGRHVMVLRGGVLVDEPYANERHRFIYTRYQRPLSGFYGDSLVGELIPTQRAINYMLAELDGNARHLGIGYIETDNPRLLAGDELLDTKRFKTIPSGSRVVYPPMANPQQFQWLDQLWLKGFEITGLNQLAATAAKPSGLRSAEALRVVSHSQSKRLSEVENTYAEGIGAEAELHLDAGKELARGGSWEVSVTAGNFIESLDWRDVEIDDYVVSMPASSQLSNDPAGRREDLGFYLDRGLVDRDEARNLINWADLGKQDDLATAERDALEAVFEAILDDGEEGYREPTQMLNLQLGIRLAGAYYNLAFKNGADQERLGILERWTLEATELLTPPPAESEVAPPPQGDLIDDQLPADPAAAAQLAQAAAALGGG